HLAAVLVDVRVPRIEIVAVGAQPLDEHRSEMLTSMADSRSDPLMTMVKAMDFQWTATTTISEYQLSLSVAQAANGFTHTVLKTQE
ncbi:hypothetical protein QM334_39145, partial [Burkholderia cenocepacia]|nr:hypothetical protein [Burkholderia cenocepacia]